MKCDKLEEEYLWTNNVKTPSTRMVRTYNADEVDEAIAELKARIQLDDDEMAGFLDLEEECGGGDLRNYIAELKQKLDEKDKEIARLDDLAHEHNIELLRKENLIAELKEERRWRKCCEEMPQNYDVGQSFLVAVEHESTTCPKGYYVTLAELVEGVWSDEEGRDIDEDFEFDMADSAFRSQVPKGTKKGFYHSKVTHWMPLPSAPKEEK